MSFPCYRRPCTAWIHSMVADHVSRLSGIVLLPKSTAVHSNQIPIPAFLCRSWPLMALPTTFNCRLLFASSPDVQATDRFSDSLPTIVQKRFCRGCLSPPPPPIIATVVGPIRVSGVNSASHDAVAVAVKKLCYLISQSRNYVRSSPLL